MVVVEALKNKIKIIYPSKLSLKLYIKIITRTAIISQSILSWKKTSWNLVLILATSVFVIITKKKDLILDNIWYIHYLIYFQKCNSNVETLIDSINEIHKITLIHTLKLDLQVQKTDIKAKKIDWSSLKTFEIIVAVF